MGESEDDMGERIEDSASILLVDDSPEKLLALETVLESLGQRLVRASSGREALRCLMGGEFAVIILDINMPGMDGFETAELIRQRKSFDQTPIIFVTAFADEMHAAHGYELGAVDFIVQPVIPDVLRTKVGVFVDLFRKNRQVRRQAESLQRRATQLHKLAAASLAINRALTLEQTLTVVADAARDIIDTEIAVAQVSADLKLESVNEVVSLADEGNAVDAERWNEAFVNLTKSVRELNKPRRLSSDDLASHLTTQSPAAVGFASGGWLAAPFTSRDGRNIGVLHVVHKHEGSLVDDDEALVVQLAQFASISIENALLARESEVNRIKDEFLATLSHELRTPLTAIMGWTQLLREPQVVAQKLSHGLDVIDRNTRAQTKLIDDLLDVSRIRTGKLAIQRESLTLPGLVQSAVDAARPAASARGQTLSLDIENNELSVYADADRLSQAVSNLLSNAIKFTPTGGRVMVGVRRVGAAVQLTVTDTGAGIARAFLPYVFDRFSQADSSSTRAHGGLGLGLTIVRHIVELHGGQVSAESAGEGLGSTFTLTLPILEVGGRSERETRRAVHDGGVARETLQGVHVLVVEDEIDSRELITAVIERAGASVTACGSVPEALQAMDATVPTVIVSDIAMPGYDGLTFMRRLRARSAQQGGNVPSIALTAYAREEDRQAALAAGFHRHMSKPVEPARLVFAIAELANGGPGIAVVTSS
jgi:signal transduction histidine kinase/DNA-binding response OmpR family regulator